MFWNHRMLEVSETYAGETEVMLKFVEVHYDDDSKPMGYTEPFMMSETVEGMLELADRLKAAAALPVMTEADFPADPVEPLAVEDVICINPIPDNFKTPEAAAEVAAMLDAIAKGAR